MNAARPLPLARIGIRAATLALPLAAVGVFIAEVETGLDTTLRNLAPLLLTLGLGVIALVRNRSDWWQPDARWPLATLGFALPAVGLSLYLHVLWHYDVDGLASKARDPRLLFAWLPLYTLLAGAIGAALGLIVGRQLNERRARRVIAKSESQ